jgi:DNA ligase-associated metallophosphoesterase
VLKPHLFHFLEQSLWLDPRKALYWQEQKAVLLSDLHLGKAAHFRKSGIAIPETVHKEDYRRMDDLIAHYHPEHVYLLGDIFHSDENESWGIFREWLNRHPAVLFHLIPGNHDILPAGHYQAPNFHLEKENLPLGPFLLSHQSPPPAYLPSLYRITGHVHPAHRLIGKGRQSLTLPCFYFGPHEAILPAFGRFTGKSILKPSKPCSIFVTTDSKVLPVKPS